MINDIEIPCYYHLKPSLSEVVFDLASKATPQEILQWFSLPANKPQSKLVTSVIKSYSWILSKWFYTNPDVKPISKPSRGIIMPLGYKRDSNKQYVLKIEPLPFDEVQDFKKKARLQIQLSKTKSKENKLNIGCPVFEEHPAWITIIRQYCNSTKQIIFGFIVLERHIDWWNMFPVLKSSEKNHRNEILKWTYIVLKDKLNTFNELQLIHCDMRPVNILWIKYSIPGNDNIPAIYEPVLTDFDMFNQPYENWHHEQMLWWHDAYSDHQSQHHMYTDNPYINSESSFRIDYWIFQFFANFITDSNVYNNLYNKHNYMQSEMNLTLKKYIASKPLLKPWIYLK